MHFKNVSKTFKIISIYSSVIKFLVHLKIISTEMFHKKCITNVFSKRLKFRNIFETHHSCCVNMIHVHYFSKCLPKFVTFKLVSKRFPTKMPLQMKHIENCFHVNKTHVLIIKSKNEKNPQKSNATHFLKENNFTADLTKKILYLFTC